VRRPRHSATSRAARSSCSSPVAHEADDAAAGHRQAPTLLANFVSNKTRRTFKAFLACDAKEGKVGFEFEPRAARAGQEGRAPPGHLRVRPEPPLAEPPVTPEVAYKLLAIFATVALGWLAGVRGWLAPPRPARDAHSPHTAALNPAQVLSDLAFTPLRAGAAGFAPWCGRTSRRRPGATLAAYFVPALLYMAAVYAWHRLRREAGPGGRPPRSP
jgi:hypothetical protein